MVAEGRYVAVRPANPYKWFSGQHTCQTENTGLAGDIPTHIGTDLLSSGNLGTPVTAQAEGTSWIALLNNPSVERTLSANVLIPYRDSLVGCRSHCIYLESVLLEEYHTAYSKLPHNQNICAVITQISLLPGKRDVSKYVLKVCVIVQRRNHTKKPFSTSCPTTPVVNDDMTLCKTYSRNTNVYYKNSDCRNINLCMNRGFLLETPAKTKITPIPSNLTTFITIFWARNS